MPIKKPHKKETGVERRRFARAPRNLAIKLEDKEADFVTETKNISCIGAYCQIDSYLPLLTKLKITLIIPKSKSLKTAKHITCEGSIVRVERSSDPLEHNKYNVAIYFNQISKGDMKLIDQYVKNNAAYASSS
jgi:hypothetical protein